MYLVLGWSAYVVCSFEDCARRVRPLILICPRDVIHYYAWATVEFVCGCENRLVRMRKRELWIRLAEAVTGVGEQGSTVKWSCFALPNDTVIESNKQSRRRSVGVANAAWVVRQLYRRKDGIAQSFLYVGVWEGFGNQHTFLLGCKSNALRFICNAKQSIVRVCAWSKEDSNTNCGCWINKYLLCNVWKYDISNSFQNKL